MRIAVVISIVFGNLMPGAKTTRTRIVEAGGVIWEARCGVEFSLSGFNRVHGGR